MDIQHLVDDIPLILDVCAPLYLQFMHANPETSCRLCLRRPRSTHHVESLRTVRRHRNDRPRLLDRRRHISTWTPRNLADARPSTRLDSALSNTVRLFISLYSGDCFVLCVSSLATTSTHPYPITLSLRHSENPSLCLHPTLSTSFDSSTKSPSTSTRHCLRDR